MCGIAGFNFLKKDNSYIDIMNYRGPDYSRYVNINSFTLAHNRLCIVDHNPDSHQPMVSQCGNYTIIFNGEVYNHNELRLKLSEKYSFKTNSDTEVILNSYIEFGENCVNQFQGMFSFAIYNKRDNKLFCARDRLGIKPFNYYFKNGKFIFASESKTIIEILGSTPDVDYESINQYLHYLYIPEPSTIFKDIKKLSPGHCLNYHNGKIIIKQYWNVNDYLDKNSFLSENEILERLDNLINDSVKKRMIADVELGSFLSGGIDSTTILYYMSKNSDRPINTYTLGFKNTKKYDETSDAQLVSKHFQTNHNEIMIEPDIAQLLPKMVRHFDEPFGNPTALLIHELTKETKKFATVALAGDGGDEVFGGYPRYEALKISEKLKFLPKPFFKFISIFTQLLPENSSGDHRLRRIKTFVNSLSKNEDEMYEDWIAYFNDVELNKLLKEFKPFKKTVKEVWNNQTNSDLLLKSSIVDIKTFLPNNLLHYGDAMSMANSFEVRFPLIDHKIVEFMTSINGDWRIKNNQTKYLMKKILDGHVPDRIINKPKMGFNPPMGKWLKNDLKCFVSQYLSKESIEKRGIFNSDYIEKIIYEHKNSRKDRSLYIWSVIVLEEWFRQYID